MGLHFPRWYLCVIWQISIQPLCSESKQHSQPGGPLHRSNWCAKYNLSWFRNPFSLALTHQSLVSTTAISFIQDYSGPYSTLTPESEWVHPFLIFASSSVSSVHGYHSRSHQLHTSIWEIQEMGLGSNRIQQLA